MPDNSSPLANPNPSPDSGLDRRIVAALETPYPTYIPGNFAAQVATEAYARFGPIPQSRPTFRFGILAARLALAGLLLAMLLLARTFPHISPLTFALQTTLAAEFILLALYLARPTLTSS